MKTTVLKFIMTAACVASAAHGLSRASDARVGERTAAAEAKRSRAREIFGARCASCHGFDGRGKTSTGEMLGVPDFTDAGWWKQGVGNARLRASITEGKGEMPAFGRKLSRTEITSLIEYVRGLKNGKK